MDNIISAKRLVVSAVDKAEIFALVEHAQTCDDALDDIGDYARENPGLITSLEHIKEVSDLLEDKFLAEPNNIIPELFEFFRKVTPEEWEWKSESYLNSNGTYKDDTDYLAWCKLLTKLRPLAISDITAWHEQFAQAVEGFSIYELSFAHQNADLLTVLAFDDYEQSNAASVGEPDYCPEMHARHLVNRLLNLHAELVHSTIKETTDAGHGERLTWRGRAPLTKGEIEHLERFRTWLDQRLERNEPQHKIVDHVIKKCNNVAAELDAYYKQFDESARKERWKEITDKEPVFHDLNNKDYLLEHLTHAFGISVSCITEKPLTHEEFVSSPVPYLCRLRKQVSYEIDRDTAVMTLPDGEVDLSYARSKQIMCRHLPDAIHSAINTLKLNPRYDVRLGRLEIKGQSVQPYELENLGIDLSSWTQLNYPVNTSKAFVKYVKCERSYDSAREIIEGYVADPSINEVEPSVIAKLIDCNHALAADILGKTAMNLIARVLDPGCPLRNMTVFHGKQGIGKSAFWNIFSQLGKSDGHAYLSQPGNDPDWKDNHFARGCNRAVLVSFDEFNRYSNPDKLAKFKEWVTTTTDHGLREMYTQDFTDQQRSFIVVGCSNQFDFLADNTGDTRIWVLSFNRPASTPFDFNAIKAAIPGFLKWAYSAFERGESREMTPEQQSVIRDHQTNFKAESSVQDQVDALLKDRTFIALDELAQWLSLAPLKPDMRDELTRALVNAGWERGPKQKELNGKHFPDGRKRKARSTWFRGVNADPSEMAQYMLRNETKASSRKSWIEGGQGVQNSDY